MQLPAKYSTRCAAAMAYLVELTSLPPSPFSQGEARIFYFFLASGAGVTPGRGDGSAVLGRWQGPRATTERGLNTGCRAQPGKATVGFAFN